jgi:hypothetical protein
MIHVHSFSEPGGHAVNEDAFAVHRHPGDPIGWLCFLADGQGGRAGGARAAQVACRAAAEAASSLPAERLTDGLVWTEILRQADQAVADDGVAGFTTLLGFWIAEGIVCGASSGDSAVFAISQPGGVQELTAHQHKNPPIGSSGALPVPFTAGLGPAFLVLAMSDGVWKYAGLELIFKLSVTASGPEVIEALKKKARLPGSGRFPDDFTLVLFRPGSES